MTPMLLGTFSQQHTGKEEIDQVDSYDQSSSSNHVETFFFEALHAEYLEKAFYFLSIICRSFEKPSNCR
jgi:hypothetical protein